MPSNSAAIFGLFIVITSVCFRVSNLDPLFYWDNTQRISLSVKEVLYTIHCTPASLLTPLTRFSDKTTVISPFFIKQLNICGCLQVEILEALCKSYITLQWLHGTKIREICESWNLNPQASIWSPLPPLLSPPPLGNPTLAALVLCLISALNENETVCLALGISCPLLVDTVCLSLVLFEWCCRCIFLQPISRFVFWTFKIPSTLLY